MIPQQRIKPLLLPQPLKQSLLNHRFDLAGYERLFYVGFIKKQAKGTTENDKCETSNASKNDFFHEDAFQKTDQTIIRWLGNSGILLNSRGTCIMVDPVLEGFDLPLLIDLPIKPAAVLT